MRMGSLHMEIVCMPPFFSALFGYNCVRSSFLLSTGVEFFSPPPPASILSRGDSSSSDDDMCYALVSLIRVSHALKPSNCRCTAVELVVGLFSMSTGNSTSVCMLGGNCGWMTALSILPARCTLFNPALSELWEQGSLSQDLDAIKDTR